MSGKSIWIYKGRIVSWSAVSGLLASLLMRCEDVWDSGQADDGAWKDDDNNDWKDENGTTSYHGGDGNKNYGGNNDKEACHK